MPPQGISDYIIHFSFIGIFLWFAFIEQITPVPEEVALVSLGYICMHTALNPFLAAGTAILGLICADNIFYFLAAKSSHWVDKTLRRFSHSLLDQYRKRIQQKPAITILIMALLPKIRFLSPLISASAGISWKLFFRVNTTAIFCYVSFYFIIGAYFHNQLHAIFKELVLLRHLVFVAFVIILALFIFYQAGKLLRAQAKASEKSSHASR